MNIDWSDVLVILLAVIVVVLITKDGRSPNRPITQCQPAPGKCVYDGNGVYCVLTERR